MCPGFPNGEFVLERSGILRFLAQNDFADAAFHFQVNGGRRFPVSFVCISAAVLLQTSGADGADAAGCMRDDANFLWQANVVLAQATFNVMRQVSFTVT